MQTLFRIVLTILSFTCMSLSQAGGLTAVKDKLAHRYSIYFASAYEGESDMGTKYGSHIHFLQPNEDATPTYEYFISQERVLKGRVLDFRKPDPRVREYTLEKFFYGEYNARILIADIEEDSNLKLAYIFFANEEEDKEGTLQTYMLLDEETTPLLPNPTTDGFPVIDKPAVDGIPVIDKPAVDGLPVNH